MIGRADYVTLIASTILLAAVPVIWAGEGTGLPASSKILKALNVNLIEGLEDQKLLVLKAEPGDEAQRLLLIADGANPSVIMESKLALPLIKNIYSPASYDGFDVGTSTAVKNVVNVVDVQGENIPLKYATLSSGEYLDLRTTEEDNAKYNFNLQFQYDLQTKKMVLKNLLLVTNNDSCDRSLLGVYALPLGRLSLKSLDEFNGADAFEYLKMLHMESQSGKNSREKLMPVEVGNNFDKALAAYKQGSKDRFNELMDYFISGGGEDSMCAPETYVVEKYYFSNNPGWSNDLGFLFEQSGHYGEAVELLSYIVVSNPDRIVAYLNLADSYWGLGSKKLAAENYKKYHSLMVQSGKVEKIPKRVIERS
ncbi:tetratricopeptide repeat protein [Pseudomonas sp. Ant30-3]|uniref:tetratricopeptide repeat protein n=1 Tax=Pseudomonas sp. Ant30-3 TaxID=1488328 RepID=UPI00067E2F99|nr:tetratricopeptide repeat protein [Pseudomonas sp. Ant30-3]